MHAVEKLKCCCCKTKFFSLMKKSKFFVLAQKEDKSLFFSKKISKKHTQNWATAFKKWTKKIGCSAAIFAKFGENVVEVMCFPKTKNHFTFGFYKLVKCHFAKFFQNPKNILKFEYFWAHFRKIWYFQKQFKVKSEKKNGFLGVNFFQILHKCGWTNLFSQNKNPFHLMILEIGQKSILVETPLILTLVLTFSTRKLFFFWFD